MADFYNILCDKRVAVFICHGCAKKLNLLFKIRYFNSNFRRYMFLLTYTVVVLFLYPKVVYAENCESEFYNEEPLSIIAIYDSKNENSPRETKIHQFAELPLNHLGYRLSYFDITKAFPDTTVPGNVAGVISWFDSDVANPDALADWALKLQTPCGRQPKLVMLGRTGIPSTGSWTPEMLEYLARAGVYPDGPEQSIGHLSRAGHVDNNMVGFETAFLPQNPVYPNLKVASGATTYLSVLPRGTDDGSSLDLVVIAPTGGYAQDDALLVRDPRLASPLWVLDPFAFFSAVFGDALRPIPDVTTLNGDRIFFNTVQPDGSLSVEAARQMGAQVQIGSELFRDLLVVPNPDIPVTVSVLTGDFEPDLAGPMAYRAQAAAKDVFQQPHVQIGTNGHDLVRDWDRLNYEANGEGEINNSDQGQGQQQGFVLTAVKSLSDAFLMTSDVRQSSGVRKYVGHTFSLDAEISGAIETAAQLSAAGRKTDCFVWPDGVRPTMQALRAVADAGICGIGGGNNAFDSDFPLLSALSSFYGTEGDAIQIYAALPSDAAFTRQWTAATSRFHDLTRTVSWTDTPRRLKPFHLGYSMNSALYYGTRSAIAAQLQQVRVGRFVPITARRYTEIVSGFTTYKAIREGTSSWRILERGALQTIRFDVANEQALSFATSVGVLGASRHNDSLYVALDPAVGEPVVTLVGTNQLAPIADLGTSVAVSNSDLWLSNLQQDECRTRISADGFGAGEIVFAAAPGSHFDSWFEGADLAGQEPTTTTIIADSEGAVRVEVPISISVQTIVILDSCGELN